MNRSVSPRDSEVNTEIFSLLKMGILTSGVLGKVTPITPCILLMYRQNCFSYLVSAASKFVNLSVTVMNCMLIANFQFYRQ
jgi:hypothetical protein